MKKRIIIAGAGGIGRACGLILLNHFGSDIELELTDISQDQCNRAETWIQSGISSPLKVTKSLFYARYPDNWQPEGALLLDCTPGQFAAQMARIALRQNMHYANLTENVPATKIIYDIAKNASTGFALQTGLAPGYINQLARKMVENFKVKHPDYQLDQIKMRVGSLSQYATSPSFYAFVWNPIGVSTEYLNESEVIDHYKKMNKPSLSARERILINGVTYEADLTSGGAADLPEFFGGKVRELNYKTLRYPGHFEYIDQLKKDLEPQVNIESLLRRMEDDVPTHDQDRVLIYCSVSGKNRDGRTFEVNDHREIHPAICGGVKLTAIQRATASALAQTAVLLLSDRFQGLLTQSRYPLDEFLSGEIIRKHYGDDI